MADTIELLETIGRDASLRHASTDELAQVLEQAQASGALTAAVASGDRMRLSEEFGHRQMEPPQSTQLPGYEEEEELDQEDDEEEPHQSPASDQRKP
jgi:hypothetical protein